MAGVTCKVALGTACAASALLPLGWRGHVAGPQIRQNTLYLKFGQFGGRLAVILEAGLPSRPNSILRLADRPRLLLRVLP